MRKQRILLGRVTKLTEPRIVYKKVWVTVSGNRAGIATLKIPAGATIVRARNSNGKCRADQAKVMKIECIPYGKSVRRGWNYHSSQPKTYYRVGKIVRPRYPLNVDLSEKCASGIHFFLNRAQAERYYG